MFPTINRTVAGAPPETVEETLADVLVRHAAQHGSRPAFSFLDRGERLSDTASFAELDEAARSVAHCLRQAGLEGSPVLLALPSNLDFVRCFLGCLYAGAIAVPAPPLSGRRALDRIEAILQDLGPAGVIIPRERTERPLPPFFERSDRVLLTADEVLRTAPPAGRAALRRNGLAFIQYTSGSLGRPRGVAVTQRNLMTNLAMIQEAFEQTPDDVMASWMPLHHDMGLIGVVLQSIYVGMHGILMPPLAFLQRPVRWLRAIDAFGVSVAGAPNFAFDLCVRLIDDDTARGLDLTRWRLAFCGAEPVRAQTLRAFARTFRPAGFSGQALLPVYGLAEATLLVSSGRAGQVFRSRHFATEAVSCGGPFGNSRIVIANAQGAPALPGEAGEICVAGSHVSPGYWSPADRAARPDAEKQIEIDGRTFLRTGDIGVIDESDLFVLGRSRDIIIVRGEKIHAEDVEATIMGSQSAADLAAAAAFAVDDGSTEALVVVCEVRSRAGPGKAPGPDLVEALKATVGEMHGVVPREILLASAGTIPRTSSGKIRRSACREVYLKGKIRTKRAPPPAEGQGAHP